VVYRPRVMATILGGRPELINYFVGRVRPISGLFKIVCVFRLRAGIGDFVQNNVTGSCRRRATPFFFAGK